MGLQYKLMRSGGVRLRTQVGDVSTRSWEREKCRFRFPKHAACLRHTRTDTLDATEDELDCVSVRVHDPVLWGNPAR